ncbi:hypothetical protein [Bifidobacterium sp. SO1]|uniref:hypothetical protein n=1 Tax=Bifidobacterium sp. SO1 TaxID=2809029 RepID=UPI001BDD08C9|nr:hypothetical protein [Bifidobacterium sp. SO1]MBT1162561.1 hypothetical protein [Bifidobacterium sp. SO1]
MSTRSGIAIKNQNGTYSWIYCHYDGYLEGVGQTLLDHYQNRQQIESLMSLGDISWLGEVPEDPGFIWDAKRNLFPRKNETPRGYHERYDKEFGKWEHWTLSYRSRGEFLPAQTVNSYAELSYVQAFGSGVPVCLG